jgi:uncharacterized protein (TIGR02217 family)
VSNLLFPRLIGVGWGTTITPHHFYGQTVARSGRSVRSQFASQPVTKISVSYSDDGWLSEEKPKAAVDGSAVYNDFETMLGFFNYHGGGFQSFLFQGVSDRERGKYRRHGELQFKGDGATAQFQLVRNVGIWAEAIYWPSANPTVYVAGVQQAAGNVTALGNGMFQLSVAPALNALVSADFTFSYRCVFDKEEMDFKEWCEGYWSVETPLTTVKP